MYRKFYANNQQNQFEWTKSLYSITCFKWSSLIYNTSARHERHKCNTSATLATRVRHERHACNTSATQVIFTPLYLLYDKWKTTRRGTISFEELPFGNALFSCQNVLKKCTTKTKLFNIKSYIKKLFTGL